MMVGVWIDGECVGVVPDDGRPHMYWPRWETQLEGLFYDLDADPIVTTRQCVVVPPWYRRGPTGVARCYADSDATVRRVIAGLRVLRACSLS